MKEPKKNKALLGHFIELWGRLETALVSVLETHTLPDQSRRPFIDVARALHDGGIMDDEERRRKSFKFL